MVVDKAPPDYGGAGAQAALLAQALLERKTFVRIIARRRSRQIERKNGYTVFLGPGTYGDGLISNVLFAVQVFFVVLLSREHVLHVHGAYYYGFTAILAGKIRRKRIILKVTLLGKDDPKSIGDVKKFGFPVGKLLVQQFLWTDVVVALNFAIQKTCLEVLPAQNVVLLPNAVDENALNALRSASPGKNVIFSGAVSTRKGVDVLLDAWELVSSSHPGWKLLLIGPIRDDVKSRVESIILNPNWNVQYLGELSQVDSWKALGDSQVFVLPSRAEGLSNSLIEAMAIGLTCVVSDIEVNREVCGEYAFYSNPGNVASLASALNAAISQKSDASGSVAGETSAYSMDRLVLEYIRIYRNE